MLKVNNIKTPERRNFIVNFEHLCVSIADFKQVHVSWDALSHSSSILIANFKQVLRHQVHMLNTCIFLINLHSFRSVFRSCQTSTTELLRENNKLILAVNYFCKNLYHGRLTGSYKRLSFMKNKILSIGQCSKSTKNAFDLVLIH